MPSICKWLWFLVGSHNHPLQLSWWISKWLNKKYWNWHCLSFTICYFIALKLSIWRVPLWYLTYLSEAITYYLASIYLKVVWTTQPQLSTTIKSSRHGMELQYDASNKISAIRKTETWQSSWTEDGHPILLLQWSSYTKPLWTMIPSLSCCSKKLLFLSKAKKGNEINAIDIDLKRSARMLNVTRRNGFSITKSRILLAATTFI